MKKIWLFSLKKIWLFSLILGLSLMQALLAPSRVLADSSLQFKLRREIVIQSLTGQVRRLRQQQEAAAIVGDKLQAVGDGIRTGTNSSAVLALDTGVGSLEVSSETVLRIQAMQVSTKGGYMTRLFLSQGQVRVKLKSFVNSESKFEIHTPSSVSGVRGTVFGVAVQPTGDTAVTIETGQVEVATNHAMSILAQSPLKLGSGDSALIPIGQQPLLQAPKPVQPELSLTWLSPMPMPGNQGTQVRIAGSTNPLNLVRIADRLFSIGLDGQFDCVLPLPTTRRLPIVIITPLGHQRYYDLVVS